MPLFKDRNDTKEPAEEETLPAYSVLPPDAFNPIEGLIAPRRYQIQHDGYMKGARIWIVDSTSNPTSEAIDAPELSYDSKAPLDTDEKVDTNVKPEINAESSHSQPSGGQSSTQGSSKCKAKKYQKFKCIDPSTVPGHYYIKRAKWKMAGTLFEGPGPDDKFAGAKKLIDINGEGLFSKRSSYSEASGQCRTARMYGAPPWYSCDRTLEDFEGNTWLFHTKSPTWLDDIEITRQSDNVQVAFFDLAAWSFSGIGMLDVKVPLRPDVFYLLLSAWYVKYDTDAIRRRSARSSASS